MLLQVAQVVEAASELLAKGDNPFMVRLAAVETLYAFRELVEYPANVVAVMLSARGEAEPERVSNTAPRESWGYYRRLWDDLLRDATDAQTSDKKPVYLVLGGEKQQPPHG